MLNEWQFELEYKECYLLCGKIVQIEIEWDDEGFPTKLVSDFKEIFVYEWRDGINGDYFLMPGQEQWVKENYKELLEFVEEKWQDKSLRQYEECGC